MGPSKIVLALLLAATATRALVAQSTRRWALVLEVGAVRSGATGAMEDGMRDAGYGDTSPAGCLFGYCSPGVPHPYSQGPALLAGASLRYALKPGLQLRAILAPAVSLGMTGGYDADPSQIFGGSYINLGSRAGSLALVIAPVLGDAAWIEFGPAVVRGEIVENSTETPLASQNLPGLLVGAGLNLTGGRRMLVELAARWRLVGRISVTPFGTTGTAIAVPMSYGSLGANVGIRF